MRKIVGLFFTLLIVGCSSKPSKNSTENIQVVHVNTIKAGDMNAVEISAYCAKTKRLFTASTLFDAVLVYDISDVSQPKKIKSIDITPYGGNVNSVAVSHGKLAMAIENTNRQENGTVAVFDTEKLVEITTYATGSLPDMVDFSPNGTYILTADEGEPNSSYAIDPKGSVTIFNTKTDSVTTVGFEVYDTQIEALKTNGIRSFGKNASFSQDVEPEYLTISQDGKTAWVVLQENNAIAEIDITNAKLKNIFPLGVKDLSLERNSLDVSDQDGKIQFKTWEHLKAFYLPDAITNVTINNITYLITANEGDSRDYEGFSEEVRVAEIQLDSTVFPNAKELQQKENLGRLKITNTNGDIDNDGDFDELYALGARSFSIWNTKGELVFDSGNDIAKQTQNNSKAFNQNDTRSDDKGSEPEALTTLQLHGKTLLFVGLERTSGVLLYDISNPKQPIFLEWINHKGDISPEGLCIIPANESPTGENILVVSNEISGTISLFEVK